jgi:hypothetical protein
MHRWHCPKSDANTYLTRVQPARTRKTHLHPQPSGRVGMENARKSCFLILIPFDKERQTKNVVALIKKKKKKKKNVVADWVK